MSAMNQYYVCVNLSEVLTKIYILILFSYRPHKTEYKTTSVWLRALYQLSPLP